MLDLPGLLAADSTRFRGRRAVFERESRLLEVVIARENVGKVALLHYHKADTVNHSPVLV